MFRQAAPGEHTVIDVFVVASIILRRIELEVLATVELGDTISELATKRDVTGQNMVDSLTGVTDNIVEQKR